ncbi:MAG: hypothetical protein ACQESP_10130 [Candidatus Muiribacteriota bacterium]
MEKQQLIQSIKKGIKMEETAGSVLIKHLNAISDRTNFSKEKQDLIKKYLTELSDECVKHKNILKRLMKIIEGEKRDVL